ncbi:MAG: hypothetical protein DRJ40_07090 [Thermoprotei archaeon]|nr:MAG: hypothetical protein DRJ40_07090 [Thermoprotei archaeon]
MGTARISISLPTELLRRLDKFVSEYGVESRSKVIVDALLSYLGSKGFFEGTEQVFGTLHLVYDHRASVQELLEIEHKYLHLIRSTIHIHVSEHICFETMVVQGIASEIRELVSKLSKVRGVKTIQCALYRESDIRSL